MKRKTKKVKKKTEDELTKEFCKKEECTQCEGTGQDGEPKGYGCHPCDEYVWKKTIGWVDNEKT